MPEFETSVNIELYCGACGVGLCSNASGGKTSRRGQPFFDIDPCEKCLESTRQEGYDRCAKDMQSEIDDLNKKIEELESNADQK